MKPAPAPAPEPEPERRAGKKGKKAVATQKPSTGKQRSHGSHPSYSVAGAAAVLVLLLVTLLFAYLSILPVDLDGDGQADFTTSYSTASQQVNRMNPDWKESLEWMKNGTPATGMDMKTVYEKEGFVYPYEAYGVMSWWDYGHMITYIAERIPNSNPFQQGVAGPDGAAAYFVSTNETESNRILDVKQTRFVVTDIEMAVSKFWAMATWYNTTAQTAPYQMTMYARNQQNTNVLDPVTVNIQPYYLTTVARLHIFDGSETAPGPRTTSVLGPVEGADLAPADHPGRVLNATEAVARAAAYNDRAAAGTHAIAAGVQPNQPIETVPALDHYRLVHESPSNSGDSGSSTSRSSSTSRAPASAARGRSRSRSSRIRAGPSPGAPPP